MTSFANIRPTFNYFGHFHNYDIKIFMLLVASILHLFSSINMLICPISRNSRQISYILKVFYNIIRVYFNVCTKIIYIICIHMYIVHIMNLKINIWTLIFLKLKYENHYFNSLKHYLNLKFLIRIWYLQFKFKKTYLI